MNRVLNNSMKVKVVNKSENTLPEYATKLSAGLDIRANERVTVFPTDRKMVKTGLFVELPEGYEIQIRPRSGLAFKQGITVLNSPGTIDADYRGEIGVILINHGDEPFVVEKGERICQMVLAKHDTIDWEEVEELSTTERGEGGFGHTGK